MLKTEEQAKQLWCPWARVLGTLRQPAQPGESDYVVAAGSENRGYAMGGALRNCNCIASQCIAWEFIEPATHDVDTGKETSPARGDCRQLRAPYKSPAL